MAHKAISVSEELYEIVRQIKEDGGFDSYNSATREFVSLYLDDRGIELDELPDVSDKSISPANVNAEVEDLCEVMGFSKEVIAKSKEVSDVYFEKEYSGNGKQGSERPDTIAAGAVYVSALLTNERTTQKEVAEASGCATLTVRKKKDKIMDAMGFE